MLLFGTKHRVAWIVVASVASIGTTCAAGPARREGKVHFGRDIRPLLSNSCYACHGPDEGSRQAGLRLDVRDDAVASAIVPGRPDESDVIARLESHDPDVRMPPPDSKKDPLSTDQVALIRRWIEQGAEFGGHWAYAPLRKPAPPKIDGEQHTINPIDAFLADRQAELGVQAAPEADRRTLVRRLYYDLTGLPPTPAEVHAFLDDDSPAAVERLVDRLLDSPHYGERMAVSWLDQVRYADTGGIHNDYDRDHWLYRDYVIDAFNKNKPFDRFTIEQLAGDLLPRAGREQRIASGYNRLNLSTEEAGSQEREFRAKYAADRVRNASSVWLASTLACAECHDHKFDAFSLRDFYSFAAFFADLQEPAITLDPPTLMPTEREQRRLTALQQQVDDLESELRTVTPQLVAAERHWEASPDRATAPWRSAAVRKASALAATLTVLDDGAVLASGKNDNAEVYVIEAGVDLPRLAAVRIDLEADPSLPAGRAGRSPEGHFVLTDVRVSIRPADGGPERPVKLVSAWATYANDGFPCDAAIDADAQSGWGGFDPDAQDHFAAFEVDDQGDLEAGDAIRVELRCESVHAEHNLGRFKLSFTDDLSRASPLPIEISEAIAATRAGRSLDEQAALMAYFQFACREQAATRRELARVRASLAQSQRDCPKLLIARSGPPRVTRVLPRGNWLDDAGEIVAPAIPASLGHLTVDGPRATRLDLAEWLVSARNPLTARVMVNRFWKLAFGEGLAHNLDDFGVQGAWPSHPELLDWLAAEFVDNGWDVKHILRTIFTSAAYRRASTPPASDDRDPANATFARQNRFRYEAEFIRDAALAVSGLMSRKIGGRSVKPYQPEGYWAYLNYPKREYVAETDEQQYRRGLYTHWQRTLVHPSLLAFDAPDRDVCVVRRNQSNTPLQALVLLNDPTYVEAARTLAQALAGPKASDPVEDNVDWLIETALSRPARPPEVQALANLFQRHLAQYQADPTSAEQATSVGNHAAPSDVDVARLAAWTSVARAVINSHEFITRN